jgi:hypothetical protein
MASPLEIQLILCDAAQADPGGKLHMLGAGWSITGTPTAPAAVAVLIKVPWDRANQKMKGSLGLLDADGQLVKVPVVDGTPVAVQHQIEFEVGRPPGLAHGSMIDAAMALNIGPLPLEPGRFEWRLDLGDQTVSTSFTVRAARP